MILIFSTDASKEKERERENKTRSFEVNISRVKYTFFIL